MSREPNCVWALKHPAPLAFSERLVLIYLAECTHGVTKDCWPSIPTIAKALKGSVRTIRAAVHRLEALGLIRIEGSSWATNRYFIQRSTTEDTPANSAAGKKQQHPRQKTTRPPAKNDQTPPANFAAESLKEENPLRESLRESPKRPLRGSAATSATESTTGAARDPAVKRKRPSRAKPRAPATPSTPMAGVGDPPPTATASTSDAGPSPAAERKPNLPWQALEIWNAVAVRSRLVVATGSPAVFARLAHAMKHPAIAGDLTAWQAHCCWLADHGYWGKGERDLKVSNAAQWEMIDGWADKKRRVERPYETEPSPIVPPWEMPEHTRQAKPAQPEAPPREARQNDAGDWLDDATINEMWRREERERAGPGAAGPS